MKTVLITGSNRGIGLELTRQYLDRGDRVIAACREPKKAEALRDLSADEDQLQIRALDVALDDSIQVLGDDLKDAAIDLFINNAGVYGPSGVSFGSVDAESWLSVFRINTIAPLLLTQALMPALRRGRAKKLVYISSKVGSIADNGSGGGYLYRSSKTALNQVVRSLSVDLRDEQFIAAALHPGWVRTDMGGPNGLIDTATSAAGLIQVIEALDESKSGGFYNYDGQVIPW